MRRPLSIALKFISLTAVVITLSACSTTSTKNSCIVNRAAFDMGSGSTKMVVARVNKCDLKIENLLLEAQRPIGFKQDLIDSKDNKFSNKIISAATNSLMELKAKAQSLGATEFSAMATSAFRTANNGKEVLNLLAKRTGMNLKIINQTTEARLGYLGAKNLILDKRPFIVWDIGGGSMQLSHRDEKGVWTHYLGKIASVSFKDQVLKKLFKKNNRSPNPLGKRRALKAIDLSRKAAEKVPAFFKDLKNYNIYGIGGVHYFSVRKQTGIKTKTYQQNDVYTTLLKRSKLNDRQIGGPYAQTDVTNLALVLGHMQKMNIAKVKTLKVNMAHGLLLHNQSW
ncbi:hypothetical protein HBN50_06505 [Halobacteriovorax sp. GB3]|uniref:Ppx/GppA phosphatase family protein n=1 Tax=Halobacteriovorax sp. GB3 TaxID=2719615 RepID=UPI0023615BDF|nr:hypothetical protein [Halobacteriovorax sp. GB3]MDD0852739.1 hypothetical protein [Halobacteriovorax sp. GB3]